MIKRTLWFAFVLVVVVAATFGLAPPSQWPTIGVSLVFVLLLLGALMTPAIRGVACNNKNLTRAAGLASIVLSVFALVFGLAFSPPLLSTQLSTAGFCLLLLLGLMLLQLPRISEGVESAVEARKLAARVRPQRGAFRPLEEVKETYIYVWRNKVSLMTVMGPWLLIAAVLPMLLFHPDYWIGAVRQNRALAPWILAGLGVSIILEVCLLLLALIQWTRFVVTGLKPSWRRLPGKPLWGLLWRWIIFGAVFRVTDQIGPWLKAHLGSASRWELLALEGLCGLALLVFASPFVLGLPAVALNDAKRSSAVRTLVFGLVGRKYYLSALLILAPFSLMFFVGDLLISQAPKAAISTTAAVCEALAMICASVVGTTFVARLYGRSVAMSDAAS